MSEPCKNVRLEVKYELGHSYREEWTKDSDVNFCPYCGTPGQVWVGGGEDYYEGATRLCMACHYTFTMPRLQQARDWQFKQRIEAIGRA